MAELRVKETGTIKLFESDNTSSVTIASPASLGADRTITLPDASVTLASGTMLATDGSGASLTALNASELGSGTVPTARLGSGTASSSTVLYGDQTYKAEPGGGKILQVVNETNTTQTSTTSNTGVQRPNPSPTITPSSTSSKILIIGQTTANIPGNYLEWTIGRAISGGATTIDITSTTDGMGRVTSTGENYLGVNYVDEPNTTSAVTYYWYFKNDDSSTSMTLGVATSTKDHLTLIEIDGT